MSLCILEKKNVSPTRSQSRVTLSLGRDSESIDHTTLLRYILVFNLEPITGYMA